MSEYGVLGAEEARTRLGPPEVTSAVKEPERFASYVRSPPCVVKRRTMVFAEILSVIGVFLTFDPLWFWLRQDVVGVSFCIAGRIVAEFLQLPAVANLVMGAVTVAVMLHRYGPQTTPLPSWQSIRWTGAVMPVCVVLCVLDPEQHGIWFAVCWALMKLLCATYCVWFHQAKPDLQLFALRGIVCAITLFSDYWSTPAAVRSLEFSFKFAALQTLIGPGPGSSYPLFRWMILHQPFNPVTAWDTTLVALLLAAQQIPALRNGWGAGAKVDAPQPTQPPAASTSWWPSTTRPRPVRWHRLAPDGAWQPLSGAEAFFCEGAFQVALTSGTTAYAPLNDGTTCRFEPATQRNLRYNTPRTLWRVSEQSGWRVQIRSSDPQAQAVGGDSSFAFGAAQTPELERRYQQYLAAGCPRTSFQLTINSQQYEITLPTFNAELSRGDTPRAPRQSTVENTLLVHVPPQHRNLLEAFAGIQAVAYPENPAVYHVTTSDSRTAIPRLRSSFVVLPPFWSPSQRGRQVLASADWTNVVSEFLGRAPRAVYQVQNVDLLTHYDHHVKTLEARSDIPKFAVKTDGSNLSSSMQLSERANEKLLFHGTTLQAVNAILTQSFDPNVSNQGLFGRGAYFAEDLNKALGYGSGKHVIIAKVALGRVCVLNAHDQSRRRAPCLRASACSNGQCHHELHDSVCGAVASRPREFILYVHYRAYPCFVVEFP